MMSAMISDVISGALSPQVVNAACNAGGKLLKGVELAHRYARRNARGIRTLDLLEQPVVLKRIGAGRGSRGRLTA